MGEDWLEGLNVLMKEITESKFTFYHLKASQKVLTLNQRGPAGTMETLPASDTVRNKLL